MGLRRRRWPPPADAPAQPADCGCCSPSRRGGLPAAMADPGWPALMDYIRRLTYVMAMGRPAAEVAVYLPSSSLWLGDAARDVAFVSTERMLAERQIDFDIINLDALATDLKAGPGDAGDDEREQVSRGHSSVAGADVAAGAGPAEGVCEGRRQGACSWDGHRR
jgi:hypothetical protein